MPCIKPIFLASFTSVGIVLKFTLKLWKATTLKSYLKGHSLGGNLHLQPWVKKVLSYNCNDKNRKIQICFCIESLEKFPLKLKTELFWWSFYIECIGFIDDKLYPVLLLYPLKLVQTLISLSSGYLWMMTIQFWEILKLVFLSLPEKFLITQHHWK